jgi:hypothetical protein
VKQLKLDLPSQPRISARAGRPTRVVTQPVVETFGEVALILLTFFSPIG